MCSKKLLKCCVASLFTLSLLDLPACIAGEDVIATTTVFPVADQWNDWWLVRLILNIIGYSTIIVPGAIIVYLVKKRNLLEKINKGCLHRFLELLAYDQEPQKQSLELGDTRTESTCTKLDRSFLNEASVLLFCFLGLQASYLTWGVLQEKVMTQKYYDSQGHAQKFTDSQFLVFVNRVLSFIFSGLYLTLTKHPMHLAPLYKYSYCSISNIMSSWCQYEALKYVSFPTQVLAKASKIIPVMLMGKVVSRKTYHHYEYITAAVMSFGMALFLLSKTEVQDKGTVTTVSGVILLAGYMVFDSFTSNWQGELFHQYHMSPVQMMCGVNFFSCLLTSVSLLQQGGFIQDLQFMFQFFSFFFDCLLVSICSAVGQFFIFYTISQFGPVVFVIIMTIRQAIAILISCIVYQHSMSTPAILGVLVVFVAIFVRMYYSQKHKTRQ